MRQIEFRARTLDNEIVFGDLIHLDFKYLPNVHLFVVDHNGEHEVTPETVAQLVGFDRNGNKVFEGDKVVFLSSSATQRLSKCRAASPPIFSAKSNTNGIVSGKWGGVFSLTCAASLSRTTIMTSVNYPRFSRIIRAARK